MNDPRTAHPHPENTAARDDLHPYEHVDVETERIIRSGTIWLAAVILTAAVLLGPSIAAGWRPADLPAPLGAAWWIGALAAAAGTALLVWAGCPVLGFRLADAYRQKVPSIRIGICLALGGIAFAGLAVLISPV